MIEQVIINEFEAISEARSFSLGVLAISSVICGILALSLNEIIELPWYSALFLAYIFQFALIIWAIDRYLVQPRMTAFVLKYTKERIARTISTRRLHETWSILHTHYNRDRRFGYLLDFLDFLLSPSDMLWFKLFKYALLICSGVVLLPYSFVANAPITYLTVLSESDGNTVTGYRSFLFSILLIGFVLFGISVLAWLSIWWLYLQGLFD
jgi:hypothetical protein